jgi:hypothetical protein
MSLEFLEFESDGCYGVTVARNSIGFSDDIGRGGGEHIVWLAFATPGERAMYINQEKMREKCEQLAHDNEALMKERAELASLGKPWDALMRALARKRKRDAKRWED